MTEKEYQKKLGLAKRKTVTEWIGKGYLPGVRDPETGLVDIPEDMPRPYRANPRTRKLSTLSGELLKAADLQQAVYPGMFPLIPPESLERARGLLEEGGLIRVLHSSTGAPYLSLTAQGLQLTEKSARPDAVLSSVKLGLAVVQVLGKLCELLAA